MSIETAYSLELKDVISALEANKYYRRGKLHDPRAFSCIGSDDCNVQLTCANFSKLPNEWIVPPYFKQSSDLSPHSSNCDYVKHKITAKSQKGNISNSLIKTGNFNLVLDLDGFSKPKADNPTITGKTNSGALTSYTKKSVSNKNKFQQKNSDVKSLRKLVDIYQSEDYDNSTTKININSSSFTLEKIFFNLDSTNEIKHRQHIYFGKATIYERKKYDKFYIIEFSTEQFHVLKNKTITDKPSILVFKDQIQKHKHLRKFEKYISTGSTFTCYFFGYPELQKYINFKLHNNYYNLFLRD